MTRYKKIIIYFFSGTGNAQKAASWIKAFSENQHIQTSIMHISKISKTSKIAYDEDVLLGFCYPTHGFNAPPIVLSNIRKFPKGTSDVFLLNTRAGLKLNRLHLPGIGGMALWIPAILLKLKGYKPRAFRPLDMPSNWISLHPGVRKKVAISIIKHCKGTVTKFSNKIFQRKRVLNGFLWLPIDLILLPVSLVYFFFGRFALSKTFFANYKCNSCMYCINNCPVNAIRLKNGRPFWLYSCENCMKCMNSCPLRAIETAHLSSAVFWAAAFSFIPSSVLQFFIDFKITDHQLLQEHSFVLIYLMFMVCSLLLFFIFYRIIHFLLKIKTFNFIYTKLTLTQYKFWRRYRITSKKSL